MTDDFMNSDKLGTEMVTIFVGPQEKPFLLHKKLLLSQSTYFRWSFSHGQKRGLVEGQASEMKLREVDPGAFDIFVHFLYTHQIPHFWEFVASTKSILDLGRFYAFADMIELGKYATTEALSDLRSICRGFQNKDDVPYQEIILAARREMDENSPMRELLIDFACSRLCGVYARLSRKHLERHSVAAPELKETNLLPWLKDLLADCNQSDLEALQTQLKASHTGNSTCKHEFCAEPGALFSREPDLGVNIGRSIFSPEPNLGPTGGASLFSRSPNLGAVGRGAPFGANPGATGERSLFPQSPNLGAVGRGAPFGANPAATGGGSLFSQRPNLEPIGGGAAFPPEINLGTMGRDIPDTPFRPFH